MNDSIDGAELVLLTIRTSLSLNLFSLRGRQVPIRVNDSAKRSISFIDFALRLKKIVVSGEIVYLKDAI